MDNMMYSVLVLAVTLCYVNAAVTVNAFDEDLESSNRVDTTSNCEINFSNRICQSTQNTEGICVGDNCKCQGYISHHQQPKISEDSCNYNACDQLCRRLGFPGGACVGDRCKCDNFRQALGVDALEAVPDIQSCNYRACDERCRRLGFPSGACVGDHCKCDNFVKSSENEIQLVNAVHEKQEVVSTEEQPEVKMRSAVSRASCDCVQRSCDFYCFRLHYTGGICLTGSCRCYK